MKNHITWNPLIPTKSGIYCHLLAINNTKILINCGGPSNFYTPDILSEISTVDCILITSFDSSCIDGLWNILNTGFYKPVYMSVPIKEYSSIFNTYEYKNIIDLKYLQPFSVNDILICAYNCGNSLGASLFKITCNLENIYVGYNINHRKENHLNGVDLKKINDSFVFITNSSYCYKENINVNIRNDQLINIINNWFTNKNKKMIIFVKYTRFHEIGLILNNINKDVHSNKELNKNTKNDVHKNDINKNDLNKNDVHKNDINKSDVHNKELNKNDINNKESNKKDINNKFIKKIVVMNKYIDKFINKSKNMIEWSNSKLIEQNDVYEYSNIEKIENYSKLSSFDICILLDEDISLLDKYNNEDTCVIFIDNKIDVSNKNIYEYEGVYEIKNEKKEEDFNEESSDEEVEHHWSEVSNEININNINNETELNKEDLFNYYNEFYNINKEYINKEDKDNINKKDNNNNYDINNKNKIDININNNILYNINKKLRNYDNYGEYINKDNFIIKVEKKEIINDICKIEKVYKETRKYIKTGLIPKYNSIIFNLQGCSDLKNIKVILQNTESKKIILVEDDPVSSKFLYTNLLCKVKDIQICKSLINISSNTNINIVNVSDVMKNIENNNNYTINNYNNTINNNYNNNLKMFRFLGRKEGNIIKYVKKLEKISLCDINYLKKKIMGINLKIDKINDMFVIEGKVIIKLEDNIIKLEGEESEIFYYVRDLLYDNIILI